MSSISPNRKPSTDPLRNNLKFQFNEDQRVAFRMLKKRICERRVLTVFCYGAETELHTYASEWALDAILMQLDFDDCQMLPVQYFSRKTLVEIQLRIGRGNELIYKSNKRDQEDKQKSK